MCILIDILRTLNIVCLCWLSMLLLLLLLFISIGSIVYVLCVDLSTTLELSTIFNFMSYLPIVPYGATRSNTHDDSI